jgi:hypothetical protein
MKHSNHALLVAPGKILQQFSKQEALQWRQRWCEIYVGKHPAPGLSQYLWHQFSWACYPSASGDEAEHCYTQQLATEVVVLTSDRRAVAILTSQPPVSCNRMDYFVFPTNLAWTMAFTHEDGRLGPYFARHPDYDRLPRETTRQRLAAARETQDGEWEKAMGYS